MIRDASDTSLTVEVIAIGSVREQGLVAGANTPSPTCVLQHC